jgi:cytochrome c biogenesis protein
MTVAVDTLSPLPGRTWRADLLDLLASMRFAIAMLTIICIASAIGTVLKQGEPLVNYVDAFGPFWADVFGVLGLFRIYSSAWFLVILAFLVVSTSLCIIRNVPKILADLKTFKEHLRVKALDAFHHKGYGELALPLPQAQDQVLQTLGTLGWHVKTQVRQGEGSEAAGVMIAARRGAANKLGYIAAHSSIVLICLGGLFDGDLVVKVQAWAQSLTTFQTGNPSERNTLSVDNPAYRAQLYVPEGLKSGQAVINMDQGMLVQPLPFDIELKKFIVEYYDTGMPKRFASQIVVHDLKDQSMHEATVEVNKPFVYDGVTIFQSSFQDGGSQVRLRPVMLNGQLTSVNLLPGEVGGPSLPLPPEMAGGQALSLEVNELRVINVENLTQADPGAAQAATDVRGVNLDQLTRHLGSGAGKSDKQLTNIGPSITYRLRDAAGQAREFQNFMVPVTLNGQAVFLLGVRNTVAEGFRYLRMPADDRMTMDGWLNLRAALMDPATRVEAARRFGARGAPADQPALQGQLSTSSLRLMEIYAGQPFKAGVPNEGGLVGLSAFIEQVVPEADRERASGTMLQMLNGAMVDLLQISRAKAGQPPLDVDAPAGKAFLTQSVLALSDAMAYPAPTLFVLDSFDHRQASVFQVTRTPGRNVVYLGCVLLIVGVFAMLYVRERRVWVWLQAAPSQGATSLKLALSSTRQTLDVDAEFDRLREALLPEAVPSSLDSAVKGLTP